MYEYVRISIRIWGVLVSPRTRLAAGGIHMCRQVQSLASLSRLGPGRGGSRRASGTGRARLAVIATRSWGHRTYPYTSVHIRKIQLDIELDIHGDILNAQI